MHGRRVRSKGDREQIDDCEMGIDGVSKFTMADVT